jgi:uncharacterized membrane protein AbrB (regulator of aidB expression)
VNTLALGATTIVIPVGASLIGLDAERAIGALAGATVFITSAKDIPPISKVLYLLVSVVIGYGVTAEIISNTIIESKVFAGFVGGLSVVTVSLGILEAVKNGDILKHFRGGGRK